MNAQTPDPVKPPIVYEAAAKADLLLYIDECRKLLSKVVKPHPTLAVMCQKVVDRFGPEKYDPLRLEVIKAVNFLHRIQRELTIPAEEYDSSVPAPLLHELIDNVAGDLQKALDAAK